MKSKLLISGCFILLISVFSSAAGETNAGPNAAVLAIHADFLKLKEKYSAFANYNDACLGKSTNGLRILYVLPEHPPMSAQTGNSTINNLRQIPPQIAIAVVDINQTNGFKYHNDFKNVSACRFPSTKLKLYGSLYIPNENFKKLVMQTVETECEKFQPHDHD